MYIYTYMCIFFQKIYYICIYIYIFFFYLIFLWKPCNDSFQAFLYRSCWFSTLHTYMNGWFLMTYVGEYPNSHGWTIGKIRRFRRWMFPERVELSNFEVLNSKHSIRCFFVVQICPSFSRGNGHVTLFFHRNIEMSFLWACSGKKTMRGVGKPQWSARISL